MTNQHRGFFIDRWVYGHLLYRRNAYGEDTPIISSAEHTVNYPVDPLTICEYTAYEDSEHMEIHQNDFVKVSVSSRINMRFGEEYSFDYVPGYEFIGIVTKKDDDWVIEGQGHTHVLGFDDFREMYIIGNVIEDKPLLLEMREHS